MRSKNIILHRQLYAGNWPANPKVVGANKKSVILACRNLLMLRGKIGNNVNFPRPSNDKQERAKNY